MLPSDVYSLSMLMYSYHEGKWETTAAQQKHSANKQFHFSYKNQKKITTKNKISTHCVNFFMA